MKLNEKYLALIDPVSLFRRIPLSMVSKVLDISRRIMWMFKFSAHIACSISVLKVYTSSVVRLPGLYAACVMLISFLIVLTVLFTTIIANIFLSLDRNIIGLRFLTDPFGLPGSGRGIS